MNGLCNEQEGQSAAAPTPQGSALTGPCALQEGQSAEAARACPACGQPLSIKLSRSGGGFIGCTAYPACTHMRSLSLAEEGADENLARAHQFFACYRLWPCMANCCLPSSSIRWMRCTQLRALAEGGADASAACVLLLFCSCMRSLFCFVQCAFLSKSSACTSAGPSLMPTLDAIMTCRFPASARMLIKRHP